MDTYQPGEFIFQCHILLSFHTVHGILKARILKLVSQLCLTLCNPMDCSHQAPLSMEFSRQEYCSGLPFPSPGDLSESGIKLGSPALQADSLPSEPPQKLFILHGGFILYLKSNVKPASESTRPCTIWSLPTALTWCLELFSETPVLFSGLLKLPWAHKVPGHLYMLLSYMAHGLVPALGRGFP